MRHVRNLTLAAALTAMASGAAMAAGPVGTPPPGGFSIDDVAFNPAAVNTTPCPAGTTCVTLTGSGGQILMREVTDTNTDVRYIQTIVGDVANGEFANESVVTTQGVDRMGSKMRMEQDAGTENAFFTEHSFYRGAGFDNNTGFPAIEVVQTLGGDFQTFYLETPNIPNNGAASMAAGKVDIDQNLGPVAGVFAHRVLKGAGYFPTDFSVSVTDGNGNSEDITVVGGNAAGGLTATYIGANMPGGGGTTADQREFGVMIYRYFVGGGGGTTGNTTTGGASTQEIYAGSRMSANDDSGNMNGSGGSFVNGDAVSMGWDEGLFGPAPL